MSFVNPHRVKDGIGKLCPWCDGTGMYCKAAPWNAENVYVECGYCKGTGRAA
jgi:DnaJ-class molecular chaperone